MHYGGWGVEGNIMHNIWMWRGTLCTMYGCGGEHYAQCMDVEGNIMHNVWMWRETLCTMHGCGGEQYAL